jgi:hypothetical protein
MPYRGTRTRTYLCHAQCSRDIFNSGLWRTTRTTRSRARHRLFASVYRNSHMGGKDREYLTDTKAEVATVLVGLIHPFEVDFGSRTVCSLRRVRSVQIPRIQAGEVVFLARRPELPMTSNWRLWSSQREGRTLDEVVMWISSSFAPVFQLRFLFLLMTVVSGKAGPGRALVERHFARLAGLRVVVSLWSVWLNRRDKRGV